MCPIPTSPKQSSRSSEDSCGSDQSGCSFSPLAPSVTLGIMLSEETVLCIPHSLCQVNLSTSCSQGRPAEANCQADGKLTVTGASFRLPSLNLQNDIQPETTSSI